MFDSTLLNKAMEAADRMYRAEMTMCNALEAYNHAREQLADEQARLIVENKIVGRNEHQREAELRVKLKKHYERINQTRKAYQYAKSEWHYAKQLAEIWTLAGYLGRKEAQEYVDTI